MVSFCCGHFVSRIQTASLPFNSWIWNGSCSPWLAWRVVQYDRHCYFSTWQSIRGRSQNRHWRNQIQNLKMVRKLVSWDWQSMILPWTRMNWTTRSDVICLWRHNTNTFLEGPWCSFFRDETWNVTYSGKSYSPIFPSGNYHFPSPMEHGIRQMLKAATWNDLELAQRSCDII